MKQLLSTNYIAIPEGVTVETKARQIFVKGPRGTLKKDLRHQPMEISVVGNGKQVRLDKWFGKRKELACVRTFTSHIKNMIIGVTQGFRYKMRLVYAHFPINVNIEGKNVEIRNFLGEKRARKVSLIGDTTGTKSSTVKDQIELEGNDIEEVSKSAAAISQACLVKKKDIRKFLDGIFVSESGPIEPEAE